jgi:uncharacterized membrane protein YoaK (UPF0700 family)
MKSFIPNWIVLGGIILSFFAGSINVISLLSIHHQAVSHLTGTISRAGILLSTNEWSSFIHFSGIILFFFFGAVVSSLIVRDQVLTFGKRYGIVIMLEATLLAIAYFSNTYSSKSTDLFLSAACGLQNAMATSFSGAILRTTHMTGIVTDIGIFIGQYLRGKEVNFARLQLHITVLTGFFVGSMTGAMLSAKWGFDSLLLVIVVLFLSGMSYTLFRLITERKQIKA